MTMHVIHAILCVCMYSHCVCVHAWGKEGGEWLSIRSQFLHASNIIKFFLLYLLYLVKMGCRLAFESLLTPPTPLPALLSVD